VEFGPFDDREGHPENSENPRCDKILTDADSLFTHPFRSRTCHREISNALTQASYTHHFRAGNKDTAVVYTRPKTQYRRHANGLAYLSQPWASQVGRLRRIKSRLGKSHLRATSLNHQDVVLDQLFTKSTWTQSCLTLGFVQPTTPATPLILPLMMLSLRGV